MNFPSKLKLKVQDRINKNFYRSLSTNFDNQLIDYSSNDYLGQSRNKIPHNNKSGATIQKKGFDVKPILSPTITKGKECIRICFHSFNTKKETLLLSELINENHEG